VTPEPRVIAVSVAQLLSATLPKACARTSAPPTSAAASVVAHSVSPKSAELSPRLLEALEAELEEIERRYVSGGGVPYTHSPPRRPLRRSSEGDFPSAFTSGLSNGGDTYARMPGAAVSSGGGAVREQGGAGGPIAGAAMGVHAAASHGAARDLRPLFDEQAEEAHAAAAGADGNSRTDGPLQQAAAWGDAVPQLAPDFAVPQAKHRQLGPDTWPGSGGVPSSGLASPPCAAGQGSSLSSAAVAGLAGTPAFAQDERSAGDGLTALHVSYERLKQGVESMRAAVGGPRAASGGGALGGLALRQHGGIGGVGEPRSQSACGTLAAAASGFAADASQSWHSSPLGPAASPDGPALRTQRMALPGAAAAVDAAAPRSGASGGGSGGPPTSAASAQGYFAADGEAETEAEAVPPVGQADEAELEAHRLARVWAADVAAAARVAARAARHHDRSTHSQSVGEAAWGLRERAASAGEADATQLAREAEDAEARAARLEAEAAALLAAMEARAGEADACVREELAAVMGSGLGWRLGALAGAAGGGAALAAGAQARGWGAEALRSALRSDALRALLARLSSLQVR
jgi:hypothetical protein